jgi:prepilin-type N-terminal cleavage/methylation domain-containing protein
MKKGFTLVETLVAISILVIALTGPLAIIASSLKSSYFSRDEITAAYLAQEPIEFIRNIRDQNGLRYSNPNKWLNIISGAEGVTFINNYDTKTMRLNLVWTGSTYELRPCGAPLTCTVKYDANAGAIGNTNSVIYGSETGEDSIFTREIYLNRSESDPSELSTEPERELIVTVVVSWKTGTISHNVTVVERIFNWQLDNQSS